jgi:hypothetical protein
MKLLREYLNEYFTLQDFEDVTSTARFAHHGQYRRDGSEYFTHPSEVRDIVKMFYPEDKTSQLAALLHDAIEDAPGSTVDTPDEIETLIRGSISDQVAGEEIIRIVRSLTHDKNVDYTNYVLDLLSDVPAARVKLSDMLHNLKDNPSPRQKQKYRNALIAARQKTGGSPPKGISGAHWRTLMKLTESKGQAALREYVRAVLLEKRYSDLGVGKGVWSNVDPGDIRRHTDDIDLDDEIFDLVQTAYSSLPGGNFKIKRPEDLPGKYTFFDVVDVDEDPEPDAVIFGKSRGGNLKLGGMGHDGGPGKKVAVDRFIELLRNPGIFAQISGAPAYLAHRAGIPVIEDEEIVRSLVGDLTWVGKREGKVGKGWFKRDFGTGPVFKILYGTI